MKKIYNLYKFLCKKYNVNPVDKHEFTKVHESARYNVSVLLKKGVKNPVCAIDIDDKFIYYAARHGENVVVNILTNEQFDIMYGGS